MQLFKDRDGRDWALSISLTTAGHLQTVADFNVFEVFATQGANIDSLLRDPSRLLKAIYALCREQCEKASISADQLGDRLAGAALSSAKLAFQRAIVDFFPDQEEGPILGRMLELGTETTRLAMANVRTAIESVQASDLLAKSSETPGSGAASSEPTPEPSPPASLPS